MDEEVNKLLAELIGKSICCCADQSRDHEKCVQCLQYVGCGICTMKINYKK